MKAQQIVRIGFAEDHTAVRKTIAHYINQSGKFNVTVEAANGRELLQKLESTSELPDLCIVDIGMPELNGFDTVDQLRTSWPHIGILVMTMHDEECMIIRMIRSGANGYLLKSCDPDEILTALTSIHKHGIYSEGAINSYLVKALRKDDIRFPSLTAKEMEFLRYCCSDMTYEQIATKMKNTIRSVYGFRDSLFRKLDVHSRVSLVLFAVRMGYVL